MIKLVSENASFKSENFVKSKKREGKLSFNVYKDKWIVIKQFNFNDHFMNVSRLTIIQDSIPHIRRK